MTEPEDMDRPAEDGYSLVVPFVVCRSQGGLYEDESFVAGFQAGEIDRSLTVIAAAGGDHASFTVRTALVLQLELLAMYRGFPVMTATECDGLPEWTFAEFATSKEDG